MIPYEEIAILGGVIVAPVLVIGGLALFWAKHSRVPLLRRVLRISVILLVPLLAIGFTLGVAVLGTCNGNALYGYGGCTMLPDSVSNAVTPIVLVLFVAAALYTTVLFLIGSIAELRAKPRS